MRNMGLVLAMMLVVPAWASAQEGPDDDDGPGGGPGMMEPGMGPGPGMGMGGGRGPGKGAWWRNPEVAKKLALTDDQKARTEAAFKAHRRTLVDVRAEVQKKEIELQDLLDAEQVDEGKVNAAADQVHDARGKLHKEFLGMMLKVRTILSRDQWRQLQELRREHRGPGKGPHGFGGPRGFRGRCG